MVDRIEEFKRYYPIKTKDLAVFLNFSAISLSRFLNGKRMLSDKTLDSFEIPITKCEEVAEYIKSKFY